jgi:hypothetical protein
LKRAIEASLRLIAGMREKLQGVRIIGRTRAAPNEVTHYAESVRSEILADIGRIAELITNTGVSLENHDIDRKR